MSVRKKFIAAAIAVCALALGVSARELRSLGIRPARQAAVLLEAAVPGPVPDAEAGIVRVGRVIDGDTIELESGEQVRYIGIDTPELAHGKTKTECFAEAATERNRKLVGGQLVRLEKDISDRDRYNRLLRYVYSGGVFVNRALVEEGYAKAATFPPDVARATEFREVERLAREARAGLWSSCPVRPK